MNDAGKGYGIIHPDYIQLPEAFSGLAFGRINTSSLHHYLQPNTSCKSH
jgi:hypothetical protein